MTPFYKERQTLRNNAWMWWLLVASSSAALIPLAYRAYSPLKDIAPAGGDISPGTIVGFSTAVVIIGALLAFFLFYGNFQIEIDHGGIRYRSFPESGKWKRILSDDIASFHIWRRKHFFKAYHEATSKKHELVSSFASTNLVELVMRSGKKIYLGTRNPLGIEWALRRMLRRKEDC